MRRACWLAAVSVGLLSLGCSSEDESRPKKGGIEIGGDGFVVVFDAEGLSLVGETELFRIPSRGFVLGTVDELDDEANYDAYQYTKSPTFEPSGLAWRTPEAFEPHSTGASSARIDLRYGGGIEATVDVEAVAPGRFAAKWALATLEAQVAFFRLGGAIDRAEGLYGLGAYFDEASQRGHQRAMQIEPDASLESAYNEAHAPVPLLVGTKGWGLFVASQYPALFDAAASADDWVEATYGTGLASKNGLDFHLFGASHPLDVLSRYYDVTGYPKLPARWALGPWIWRDENDDQAQVEKDLQTIRQLDLAATGYWIDRPYATEVNTFDFNSTQFPDPVGMIQLLHDLGFRTALWHSPYLSDTSAATKDLRDYATSQDFYPPQTGLLLNKWGKPVDLTKSEAYDWWQSLIKKYTAMGVEGFKLDYGEDVVVGFSGKRLSKWKFHDGSDERTMHQGYNQLYHSVYAELLPESGGFLLVRHGNYGDQVNGGIFWPGDEDTGFAKHKEKVVPADGSASYVAVGGLPATVAYGLSLSASGFPFFGSDTGGYRHTPPTPENFIRWFEQTSLSTVMQIGTSANDVAWELFNASTDPGGSKLELYRRYSRLHLRLWPYEWTYATEIAGTGRPIVRPLGLSYPELGLHPSDAYMFGDDLLVAPVLAEGATTKTVPFPPGRWIDWWDGTSYDGGSSVEVSAPLGKLPLFLRQSAIVPLLRPTIDTLAPTAKPAEIDSYATDPGVLYPRVVAGPASSFVLFDGTTLSQSNEGEGIELSYQGGTELKSGAIFEVIAFGAPPSSVTIDGAPATKLASLSELEATTDGWAYAADQNGTLYVKVGSGEHRAVAK